MTSKHPKGVPFRKVIQRAHYLLEDFSDEDYKVVVTELVKALPERSCEIICTYWECKMERKVGDDAQIILKICGVEYTEKEENSFLPVGTTVSCQGPVSPGVSHDWHVAASGYFWWRTVRTNYQCGPGCSDEHQLNRECGVNQISGSRW